MLTVQLVIQIVPVPALNTPPPASAVLWPVKLPAMRAQLVSVAAPALYTPPPSLKAEQVTVQLVSVAVPVPALYTPPPS